MTRTHPSGWLSRIRRDEAGFGLVLVLSVAIVVGLFVSVIVAIATRSLHQSTVHVSFETALDAAETGIDQQLSAISNAYNSTPSVDFATPSPCNVTSLPNPFPSTPDAERDWAKTAILGFPANVCTQHTPQGDYVAFRPLGRNTVYSMGWSPNRQNPNAKVRLIKAEYLFAPWKPGDAVLTRGDLNFSGSVAVNTLTSSPADVHTNSNLLANGSSSLQVQGSVSSTGSNALAGSCPSGVTGTCKANTPVVRVPVLSPLNIYTSNALTTNLWYDLCPDGSVKSPSANGPCEGTTIVSAGPFNGWVFTPATSSTPPSWTLSRLQARGTAYPGVYYVYGADASVGDNGTDTTLWNISVLAQAMDPSDVPSGYSAPSRCNKYGGNIDWKLFTIQNYLKGLIFDAQGTLSGTANTNAGDGLMVAGDNVNLQTSSNTITGSIVSGNQCTAAGGNTIQGVTINYDDQVESPLTDVINTTLWLEYVG